MRIVCLRCGRSLGFEATFSGFGRRPAICADCYGDALVERSGQPGHPHLAPSPEPHADRGAARTPRL